jgi:uncharacterized cupredoxin-like copper-binding protein
VRSALYRLTALALAAAASIAALGCGATAPPGRASGVIRISERDFHISAPKRVQSGDFVLAVKNNGPADHELILAKEKESGLPFREDGLTVDEDAVESSIVGALEPGEPHKVRRLRVHLPPGKYAFFCNMSGHYLGGMYRDLEVR